MSKFIGVMLAQEFSEKRVRFPIASEPKLDGFRTTFNNGVGYIGRNGASYESMKPYAEAIAQVVGPDIYVDGEVISSNWNAVSKLIKRTKDIDVAAIKAKSSVVIFDVYSEKIIKDRVPFLARREQVKQIALAVQGVGSGYNISKTKLSFCTTGTALEKAHKKNLADGFEGTMIKTLDGVYVPKRSFDWQKWKPFIDRTMEIIGGEVAHGLCPACSLKGATGDKATCKTCKATGEIEKPDTLGALLCKDSEGNTIKVGGGITAKQRKDWWRLLNSKSASERKQILGRKADITVQDDDKNDIVARHANFARFRPDMED